MMAPGTGRNDFVDIDKIVVGAKPQKGGTERA